MEHEEIMAKLNTQEEKIDAIYKSVEKARKYFLIIIWISIIAFVLPLIGIMFAVPSFIDTYSQVLSL